ncbi:putative secreted protein (Por secretion system target) [Ulvibacter sp. MAR_2010_11]|uniref:T9SS type A sorting domain-containing protein n=1 Tax=Ulvibacter sp. MAR_2010_11 TaxID=1250229 RepID=UPI000C2C1B23|nr:T9SS type A sorting domain-containing protein [Ulvibacter sp. MAR_2010_11]PKA82564.1 putative secreted protein (Por secretion system target) [Ulvibacter sp. MAR_2010_11]
MKTKITLLIFLIGILQAFSQDPAIVWQNTIGGSDGDFLTAFEPTADGGYILGGYSTSNISGDKTENSNGAIDIWIVKIDAAGTIQWQNTIGGSGDDFLISLEQTADGGYIVGSGSDSNISGDKTENSRGGLDYWLLKLNASGAIVWQKTYGGAQPEFDTYIVETADGGYFVGGYSDSDVSGEKTDPTNGQRDYWALKLDSTGAIVWQNGIGGNLVDRPQAAFQTIDGGYIIGGFSNSAASGDKSENSQGGNDYWVVKLDATGAIEWENTIGGNDSDVFRDMIQIADGSYLLGGYSKSNASGDKTENSQGDYDYWILKLDTGGNIVWQNTIGGSGIDYPRDIKQLSDGTIMIAGWSNSNVSGDKTEASNGGYDYWLVKLNSGGTLISQNSIGGSNDESGPYVIELPSGDFVMACSSDSNVSGDKGDASEGMDDYWVFETTPAILGVTDNTLNTSITAYPNPTSGSFSINLGESFTEINVIIANMLGQTIVTRQFKNTQSIQLELPNAPGMYLVTIQDSQGKSATIKMLKN